MAWELLKDFEGFSPTAYKDPKGVWTIGYGTTVYSNGQKVKKDDFISEVNAKKELEQYILDNIADVFNEIPYILNNTQREALVSLIYNVGRPAYNKSKLRQAIIKRDFAGIFREWDFGITQLNGLVKRRAKEKYFFINYL